MFLSRFWYLVVAVLATLATAAVLLVAGAFERDADIRLKATLLDDVVKAELLLKLDARAHLDALSNAATDSVLQEALRYSSAGRLDSRKGRAVRRRVNPRLKRLNRKMKAHRGDFFVAVDKDRKVVGHTDSGFSPGEGMLRDHKAVRQGVKGYLHHELWDLNDDLYLVAVRPVLDSGTYIGALVHGRVCGEDLVKRIARQLPGATVLLANGDRPVADHLAEFEGPSLAPEVLQGFVPRIKGGELKSDVPGGPMAVQGGMLVAARLDQAPPPKGKKAEGAAPAPFEGPTLLVGRSALGANVWDSVTSADVTALPWVLLVPVFLVLFGVGMLSLFLEWGRPFGNFKRAFAELASYEVDRIDVAKLARRFRPVAESVNAVLDFHTGGGQFDSNLGTSDHVHEMLKEKGPSTKSFGFANPEGDPVPPPPGAAPSGATKTQGGASTPIAGEPVGAPRQVVASPRQPKSTMALAPEMQPVPAMKPPGDDAMSDIKDWARGTLGGDWRKGTLVGVGIDPATGKAVMRSPGQGSGPPTAPSGPGAPQQVPPAPIMAPAMMDPVIAPGTPEQNHGGGDNPPEAVETSPGRVMSPQQKSVAAPNIKATQAFVPQPPRGAPTPPTPAPPAVQPQAVRAQGEAGSVQGHFREVYDLFIAEKRRNGESVTGLTFEKFSGVLKRNRETILSQHQASEVRFTVYSKNGKASVKATPIK